MPLSVLEGKFEPTRLDRLLECGYRRNGWFFYRTQCPSCQACEPLRLDVARFVESRSMRRAKREGSDKLGIRIAPPTVDADRVNLFNAHRFGRELDRGGEPITTEDYTSFLVNAVCEVWELSFWYGPNLVAISITDVGANSLSAVYCFFDPKYSWLSPGTFAILAQISIAQAMNYQWLYLGMYVQDNPHLCYKSRFKPHQRLIQGQWESFE